MKYNAVLRGLRSGVPFLRAALVSLYTATGGAAFRLDADLAAGWSDASAPFASPRLHGGGAGDFSVVDVEFYALRPLW